MTSAARPSKKKRHQQEQKRQRRQTRKQKQERRRRTDEAGTVEHGGGGEGGEGTALSGGEDETPAWVRPIPDEAVLFGPDAWHEPVYPDRPDSGHYYIHLGDHQYFMKQSGIVGGQVPAELLVNDLGRAAGFRAWPFLRAFPDPSTSEEARVIMNRIPGDRLDVAAGGNPANIREVLHGLDPRSVADTLTLEMVTLAGDRHDGNSMVSEGRLIGIDYQTNFHPGWQARYGVVASNLPDEFLATPLNRDTLSAILDQSNQVLQRVLDEVSPAMSEVTGNTPEEVVAAIDGRFDIVEELLHLETPTLGDLIRLHPDRPGGTP